jgi:hypothetical protein
MNAIFSKGGSGIGSLICFMGLATIAWHASEHGWPPLWLTLVVVLSLCYLWRFVIQPFRSGLSEEGHGKNKGTKQDQMKRQRPLGEKVK